MQEYKEGKRRESGSKTNEIFEEKDQDSKLKIEEILTLMKVMNKGQKEKEEEKESKNSSHGKAQEGCPSKEWEKMRTDADEPTIGEGKETNELPGMTSVEKKKEDGRKDTGKIKKNRKDDDARKHTEKMMEGRRKGGETC